MASPWHRYDGENTMAQKDSAQRNDTVPFRKMAPKAKKKQPAPFAGGRAARRAGQKRPARNDTRRNIVWGD